MSVLGEILEWSKRRPLWQRDALRRIVTQQSLTEDDVKELEQICLCEHGNKDQDSQSPVAQVLEDKHLPPSDESFESLRILQIRDVVGVNTLAANQELGFGSDGMTIVFGYNGAGKSGYARILKRLCKARDQAEQVLANVFTENSEDKQMAVIRYQAGDHEKEFNWQPEVEQPREFSQASFFDSKCANLHVDNTNELAFMPFGLDVMQKLYDACKALESSIQKRITLLESATPNALTAPQIAPDTAVAKCLKKINSTSKPETFEKLSTLSDAEASRLIELNEILAVDPRVRVSELQRFKKRLQLLGVKVVSAEKHFRSEYLDETRSLLEELSNKKEAAKLAAQKTFGSQPLLGVGEAVWRQLWEAARQYSVQMAYQDRPFPNTEDGSRCVLCLQELSNEAKSRLQSFEKFIERETQKQADEVQRTIQLRATSLGSLGIGRSSCSEYMIGLEIDHTELCKELRLFLGVGWKIAHRISLNLEEGKWTKPAVLPPSPKAALSELIDNLDQRVQEIKAAEDEAKREKLVQERNELQARNWLAENLASINVEIVRQQQLARFRSACSNTNTQGLTRRSSELTKTYVTEAVKSQFSQELKSLGVDHLQIELIPQGGKHGVFKFKIGLKDAVAGSRARDVLSEGEFRCISMASFLAELSTEESNSALVFDDPMSSLDHVWKRAVAERLASEAQTRQVIVFTHDIAFWYELTGACESIQVPVEDRYLSRRLNKAGVCTGDKPWHLMKISDQIKYMNTCLTEAEADHRQGNTESYEIKARNLYGLLREAWEKAVEEVLLYEVVIRFDYKVQTQRLPKILDVELKDIQAVNNGMTKCSRYIRGHKKARALIDPPPNPEEIRDDISMLKTWAKEIRSRHQ